MPPPKDTPSKRIMSYHGVASNRVYTAEQSPALRWALTSPFHPYRTGRRSFSVTLLYPYGQLPVKKYGALCCPDVPPVLKDERQTGRLQCDKGNSFNRQLKIENRDNHIKMVRYGSLLLFFQSNLFSIMLCICSTLLKINYIDIWWQVHGKHSAFPAVILLNVWPFGRQLIVKKVLCITQYC